jgi:hypothetical protein
LIDLYKAARTVADVEAANGKVKDEVLIVQSVASDPCAAARGQDDPVRRRRRIAF